MNEYRVTVRHGWDKTEKYVQAESAATIQQELETQFAYEIVEEGLTYKIERL